MAPNIDFLGECEARILTKNDYEEWSKMFLPGKIQLLEDSLGWREALALGQVPLFCFFLINDCARSTFMQSTGLSYSDFSPVIKYNPTLSSPET